MMDQLKRFFQFCSGVDPLVLKRCPTDQQKYLGIGATVFFTGVLAFVSSAYAIWTVFHSVLAAIGFGLIWGLMIFNLDRYIVSSMKSRGSFVRDLMVALPRIGLAVLLAIVIAKPLEMKIFESEIEAELVVMEQETFKEQEDRVRARYQPAISSLEAQVTGLKSEIDSLRVLRDAAVSLALQEADGTGGSMRRNLGPIYRAKKAEADRMQAEFDEVSERNLVLIDDKQGQINDLSESEATALAAMGKTNLTGFAARLNALSRLAERSQAIWLANLFIMFLFIAIECAPIFVKLISYRSPYDYVLHKHEMGFEMSHRQRQSLLTNATRRAIRYDSEVGTYRTQKAILAEKQLIDHHLKQEVETRKGQPASWQQILRGIFPV